MVLSDIEIKNLCRGKNPMISPFVGAQVRSFKDKKLISCGVSSYGYDARLSTKFWIFEPVFSPTSIIDPKEFDTRCLKEVTQTEMIIPPHSVVLGQTLEKFRIPRNIIVICIGKSTYTRCGVLCNVATLEPEWEGVVTMEISNTAPLPAKVYANEGICQFLFLKTNVECEQSYADKKGVYQSSTGITPPKV